MWQAFVVGTGLFSCEANSGRFRSCEELAFLRATWDSPIVLKGIQVIEDAHAAMDAHVTV